MALGFYHVYTIKAEFWIDWRTSLLIYDSYGSPDLDVYYDLSNPNTPIFTRVITGQLLNETVQQVWNFSSYPENKTNLQPLPPQNLTIENFAGHPKITWQHGISIDYLTGYEILRTHSYSYNPNPEGSYTIGTVDKYTTSYTDNSLNIGLGGYAYYKVRAINGNRYSSLSNFVSIQVIPAKINVIDSLKNKTDHVIDAQLYQNYPNPSNPSTRIKFYLPKNEFGSLKVYDLVGREVAVLVNGFISEGFHEIDFNTSGLATGIYIYQLTTSKKLLTNKLMVLK